MRKVFVILFSILLFALLIYLGIRLYFADYKKLSEDRIIKVIDLQGANFKNADVKVNTYGNSGWLKIIYFNDDPEIAYEYNYERQYELVRVFARYNNMSLDLAKKKAKYPLLQVQFDRKGNVTKVFEN